MARPKKTTPAPEATAPAARKTGIPKTPPVKIVGTEVYMAHIEGVTPLLSNRFDESQENEQDQRAVRVARGTPREQAEKASYRFTRSPGENEDAPLYHPAMAILRLLRESGRNYKQRGNRQSYKSLIPGAVAVLDDVLFLLDADGNRIRQFEVDSRPVVILATKGRIMRHRPKFFEWEMAFSLEIDTTLIAPEFVHQLLSEGGKRLGIGDFRPEKGGSFGRFILTNWKKVGD